MPRARYRGRINHSFEKSFFASFFNVSPATEEKT